MIRWDGHRYYTVFLALAILGTLVVRARGQEEEEDVNRGVDQAQQFVISDQEFDRWVLGDTADVAQTVLEACLRNELRLIDEACSLTEAQRKKLELGGLGDIARFFDRVAQFRERYVASQLDAQKRNEFLQEPQTLRVQSGEFSDWTFMRKVMASALTEDQLTTLNRERRRPIVERAVQLAVMTANKRLDLSDEQHQAIVELLLDKAYPPSRMGKYGPYLVLLNAARLEDSLKQILDDEQWAAFHDRILFAQRTVPGLRARGVLPEADYQDPRTNSATK